ncbi:retrovirus-related pol polyprotein from transposon TNT 1-94 [Tanacetum coccineum]
MTRSSTKKLITPFENPKRVFHSKRRLFETHGLMESSSPEFDLFSDIEEHSKEEKTTKIITETMEQYMSKTHGNYGSGVARPKINDKIHFELKGKFLKKFGENTFSGSENEDANEHIEKVLEIVYLFHIPEILESKGAIPTKSAADAKVAIQEMADPTQQRKEKVNEKVYAAQFGAPYQPGGQYRAAGLGFYQRNNINSSYPDRRQTLEESLTKFMAKSAKRHEENSNIIKELNSTDAAIRNQEHRLKTLEAREVKILEAFDHTLPQKEKDPGRFTLPCFIYNVCFDKALVDLGASVSVMPFSTYSNLGLGNLAHTRLTIELADKTIKHPRGIAENVLVRIGKFIFPIDFVILDIHEDDDVPLILGRPFLSIAHAKIDVFKRKITLRVGEEKLVFKSIKPATSIIRMVYMVKERTDIGSKTEFVGEAIKESFNPLYGNYIELNDLDMPLEPRMNQDDFKATLDFVNEPTYKSCYKMKFSYMIRYRHVNADFLPYLSINTMTKRFYNSIIKDKGDHEGKNLAGTLIDIPIFVGNFSIISGFSITGDIDITSVIVLGMPFCKKFVSCQNITERFAHGDKCERMDEE